LREELAAASQRADALAGEKSALARALEEAEKRADAADTCAAPLRLETAAALARCKRGEDAARAMADRLAVARVAHAQAMAALNEVGARLGDESAALEGGTDGVEGKTNATTPLVVASPAVDATLAGETEPPETFPVSGDDVELRSPAAPVGMDIMYETEPPSEMPAKQGDASSDPIPETEAAAAGGAEPEPERDAAVREPDDEPDADEPAADEPVSLPASAGGARRQSTVSSVLGGIVDAVADAVAAEVVAIDEAPEDAERDAEEAEDAETEEAEDAEEEEEAGDALDEADDADEVEVVEDAEEDEDVAEPVAPRPEAPRAPIPASAADKENVDAREKSYPASESEIGGAVPMSFLEGR
jgi:hypothetical protein